MKLLSTIPTKSHDGLQFMAALARAYAEQKPLSLTEVAKAERISAGYLEEIVVPLKAAKLIKSLRGRSGGYLLSRAPQDIDIGQILKALDVDATAPVECLKEKGSCPHINSCATRPFWQSVSNHMEEVFARYTLKDFMV